LYKFNEKKKKKKKKRKRKDKKKEENKLKDSRETIIEQEITTEQERGEIKKTI